MRRRVSRSRERSMRSRSRDASMRNNGAGGESEHSIRVILRVRPPLEREVEAGNFQNVCDVDSADRKITLSELVPDPSTDGEVVSYMRVTDHVFTFDHVHDSHDDQEMVYTSSGTMSTQALLQGYNSTILAYGQTGTGKTHTMEGFTYDANSPQRGIIARTMDDLFQSIQNHDNPNARFLVRASYLQIYNEQLSDLLKPDSKALVIRENKSRGVFVDNLSEWVVRTPREVYELMERGGNQRVIAQTKSNDISSRSHTVFMINLEQTGVSVGDSFSNTQNSSNFGEGQSQAGMKLAKLNLVDLAGSERVHWTGAKGQQLEESKKINTSLLALGNVIQALADNRQHIPYRDSKLTRLLEDSLGGNCITTIMAMISPAYEAFSESLSTLKFANRAKAILNAPKMNAITANDNPSVAAQKSRAHIQRCEEEIHRLKADVLDRDMHINQLQAVASQAGTNLNSQMASNLGDSPSMMMGLQNGTLIPKEMYDKVAAERDAAEQAKEAAVSALEERSRQFYLEREQKKRLEDSIVEMSQQLLHAQANPSVSEDQAQVQRYKQLLLKQRDIMHTLTERLEERDESISALSVALEVERTGKPASGNSSTRDEAAPGDGTKPDASEEEVSRKVADLDKLTRKYSGEIARIQQERTALLAENRKLKEGLHSVADAGISQAEINTICDSLAASAAQIQQPAMVKIRMDEGIKQLRQLSEAGSCYQSAVTTPSNLHQQRRSMKFGGAGASQEEEAVENLMKGLRDAEQQLSNVGEAQITPSAAQSSVAQPALSGRKSNKAGDIYELMTNSASGQRKPSSAMDQQSRFQAQQALWSGGRGAPSSAQGEDLGSSQHLQQVHQAGDGHTQQQQVINAQHQEMQQEQRLQMQNYHVGQAQLQQQADMMAAAAQQQFEGQPQAFFGHPHHNQQQNLNPNSNQGQFPGMMNGNSSGSANAPYQQFVPQQHGMMHQQPGYSHDYPQMGAAGSYGAPGGQRRSHSVPAPGLGYRQYAGSGSTRGTALGDRRKPKLGRKRGNPSPSNMGSSARYSLHPSSRPTSHRSVDEMMQSNTVTIGSNRTDMAPGLAGVPQALREHPAFTNGMDMYQRARDGDKMRASSQPTTGARGRYNNINGGSPRRISMKSLFGSNKQQPLQQSPLDRAHAIAENAAIVQSYAGHANQQNTFPPGNYGEGDVAAAHQVNSEAFFQGGADGKGPPMVG